jgi:hypothetical protein
VQGNSGGDRETERWLRRVGLPYFVRRSRRGDALPVRMAPFIVFLLVAGVLLSGVRPVDVTIEVESAPLAVALGAAVIVFLALLVALPIAAGVLSGALLRRTPDRAALLVAIGLVVCYLVIEPLVVGATQSAELGWATFGVHLLVVPLAGAVTWLGVGALLAATTRVAWRQLAAVGALVTRALPILMLVIVFAFFSRPVWEVTSTMSPGRLIAVAVFFALLGLAFVIPISRREMHRLEEDGTRLPASAGDSAPPPAPPLAPSERRNLQAGLVLALALQTALFSVIVGVILTLLGTLAFSREVLEEWVGDRLTTVQLFGIDIPFTWALLKTAVFLSCVSSLNFLVSVTTNAAYRESFFHPLLAEARGALAVRAAYLRGDPSARAAAATAAGPVGASAGDAEGDDGDDELPMIEPGPGSAG